MVAHADARSISVLKSSVLFVGMAQSGMMVWVPLLACPAVAPTSKSVMTFENSYNTCIRVQFVIQVTRSWTGGEERVFPTRVLVGQASCLSSRIPS
jgi:hypothetical protein